MVLRRGLLSNQLLEIEVVLLIKAFELAVDFWEVVKTLVKSHRKMLRLPEAMVRSDAEVCKHDTKEHAVWRQRTRFIRRKGAPLIEMHF